MHIVRNAVKSRSKDPENVMGRTIEAYWVRMDTWFLPWHKTDDELELFDLNYDTLSNTNLIESYPQVTNEMMSYIQAYREGHGIDLRISYFRGLENQ